MALKPFESNFDVFPVHKDTIKTKLDIKNKKKTNSPQIETQIINFLIISGNTGKTRKELVTFLHYPRTTIYDSISRLNRKGLIETEHKLSKKGKGRPNTVFYLKGFPQQRR